MSAESKDTIYIDIDDEITDVIEKLKSSKHKIVALVLPKRAAMLQSTVNMRLLKRAAQQAHKNTVLITNDHNILPLAGAVGLHVAKSLQSKPFIPPLPKVDDQLETIDAELPAEPKVDETKSIGELAGLTDDNGQEETIEVDNEELAAAGGAAEKAVDGVKKFKKKFKIPNFEKFRLKLFLAIAGVILLFVGWFWAFVLAPKAKVTIKTDTSNVTSLLEFTAKTDTQTLDLTNNVLPAEVKSVKKTQTEKVPATGQKNVGNKAKGTMSLKNCTETDGGLTIPAGTAVTASNLTFLTDTAVTLPASVFSGGGTCLTEAKDVGVTAKDPGDQFNLSARNYTVSGRSAVRADGSAMTGGTTDIKKVVGQADIDAAKAKTGDTSGVAEELRALLTQSGSVGLTDSLSNENPTITATPKVGEEATEVTVVIEINYTMLGVQEADLKQFIEGGVKDQIDANRQSVVDHGIKDAVFRVVEQKSAQESRVSLQTLVTIGPNINPDELKKEIIGKKRGDVQKLIGDRPGVKEVRVDYSPFWVFSTPKAAKKITIVFEQTNAQP